MEQPTTDTGPRPMQVTVTWGLPEEYGGMTAAMLRRSRGLAARGADVALVTFDDRPDYDPVRRRLGDAGELDGIVVRNIYEDFRRLPRDVVGGAAPGAAASTADEEVVTPAGTVRRWREEAGLLRVEHLRADGSPAVVEEAAVRAGGTRRVTALDAAGRVTGRWSSVRGFRLAWLGDVVGEGPAVVTVDSKTAAKTVQHFSKPGVATVLMVHSNHRLVTGEVSPSRGDVFDHLDRWDAVVVLTARHGAALDREFGAGERVGVVGNAVRVPASIPDLPVDRMRGVVVSRLTPHKRIDDILRTVAGVRERGVPVTLEVVGDGPARSRLEALAGELGLADVVTFSGHVPTGADRFATGAWTMLASRTEGESLTLSEAMGAGCVPVSYDIDYGPAEAIRPGVNGFLVPDGDVPAAIDALERMCRMPDADHAAMRAAARADAAARTEDAMLDAWAEVHAAALARRAARPAPAPAGRSLGERVLRRLATRLPPAWRR